MTTVEASHVGRESPFVGLAAYDQDDPGRPTAVEACGAEKKRQPEQQRTAHEEQVAEGGEAGQLGPLVGRREDDREEHHAECARRQQEQRRDDERHEHNGSGDALRKH